MTVNAADSRRRGRGSGGVQKRDKAGQVWRLFYDAPPGPDGGRRRRTETFHGPRGQAERRLRELLSKVDRGDYVEPSSETTADYLKRWLGTYAAANVSPRTMRDYVGIVDRYLVPALGSVPVAKLRPDQIQSMYAELLERGLGGRTVLHVHRLLHQALGHAVKWQILSKNPCQAVDPPRAPRKEMQALDRDKVRRFLDGIAESPYREVFKVDLYTGLRRSELLALKWPQVDTEGATVSIIAGLHRLPAQGLVLLPTKTASSRRLVDLPPAAVEVLHDIRARQVLLSSETGLPLDPEGFVFAWPGGDPFDPDAVSRDFHKRVKAVGLDGIRFHDLRHTFASLMLAAGVEPKKVQAALGHSSIMVTMDIYGHLMPGAGKDAAERFAEYVGNP